MMVGVEGVVVVCGWWPRWFKVIKVLQHAIKRGW